ncbi:MAG TPA: hypothetical protein DEG44_00445, partial [Candidatus Kerfeldbacteria bacterium]|nr:hypothetical protein [Candidatus Kerfeldbacteria bacterium]
DNSRVVTTVHGKTYTVDNVVSDAVTGLVFLHVPSTGLRIAEFRETELELGESVVAYTRTPDGEAIAFANVGSADMLDRILPNHVGAPLYDFNLAVVGFVTDTGSIIPIQLVNEVAYDLFTTGTIDR